MSKIKNQNSKIEIDIDKLTNLANLSLTKGEKTLLKRQLGEILNYVSKLKSLETKKIEPIGHITGTENISREDKPSPSLSQQDAIKNAKKIHNGFFEVDAIFEELDL
jgi:aspartyl-tRNA(Asn)/glutamyl-tRNA(Gln) amidotransferase subunit C